MKSFSMLTLGLTITLLLSACGAKATPPPALSVADIQSTVAAVALTMIVQTQAAIPTATPIPPTETFTNTPLPTDTSLPLPGAGVLSTPVPNGSSGGEKDCIHKVMPDVLQGKTIKIRLNNSTKAALTVSVNLNQTDNQSQCGYRTYSIEPGQFVVVTDLIEGCYTVWAWNPDPKGYFIVTNGTSCLDSSYPWAFDISTSSIKVR